MKCHPLTPCPQGEVLSLKTLPLRRLEEIIYSVSLLEMEKEMTTHSSNLAWRIPWMEELGGLQSTVARSRT